MMEFVENSDKALAALEKREGAKQQNNEVKHKKKVMMCCSFIIFSILNMYIDFVF